VSSGPSEFEVDDVIVAWEKVLDGLPRGIKVAVQEAQPVAVDGNVVTFGVSRTQIDNVKPRFQKEAQTIREAFIAHLGSRPRFKFVVHDFTGSGNGPAKRRAAAAAAAPAEPTDDAPPPDDPPPLDDEPVDLSELVDAPPGAGAVDSVTRLQDVFGATVVDEQVRD
jgi:hypothetical protein